MKFLNKKTVFLVLLSVFMGFILGQNYDIAKNYFNFEFLKATVSPTLPSPFEEPELNFSEIDIEDLLLEEELVPENEKVNEIEQVGQVKETTQLTLAEIQEVLDDINEQIDTINQEINKLRGEILEFSESEEESIIEEEILFEEELEDEEEEKDEEKEEKEDICPGGININTVSKEELEKITGVGPVIAQKIIDARPFSSIYDLTRVAGIGEKTLEKIIEQACAYIEGDIGRPSSAGASGGGGGGASVSLAPMPIINLSFPIENPANKNIKVNLSVSNFKTASYDVKISIFEISEQSEQKRTLSEIYDGEKWQSSYNYLLKVFSETSFEGNFQLRIKQDKQDFRGEADIVVKIRDNEKEKIQTQWQGKINIIEPELEEEELKEEDLGGEEGEGEQGEEQKEEQEQGEEEEEENGEKIFFEISPLSLIFRAPYGEIPEPQLLYVSGLVDGVYVSSLIDGLVFPSWIIVEAEQDNFKVSVDVSGKNPGTYEDVIEINYRSQSEKISVSLEIFEIPEEVKNLLKNEFFEEWEDEKPLYWEYNTSTRLEIYQSTEVLQNERSLGIKHNLVGPINIEQQIANITAGLDYPDRVYGEIWVKGTGYIRIGIKAGQTTFSYSYWKKLDDADWTLITFDRISADTENTWQLRIQTTDKDPNTTIPVEDRHRYNGIDLHIGAVWLGTAEPPADWQQ